MARAEAAPCGIPDFGPVVERTHLLRVARTQSPALTVVCAPPGYGKSVFAAQCAAALHCDEVAWVSLYDTDLCGDEWLARVVEALAHRRMAAQIQTRMVESTSGSVSRADALLRIRDSLAEYGGKTVLLVLDGANHVRSLEGVEALGHLLRRSTSGASRLVLTCRRLQGDGYAPDPTGAWLVGEQDLRFDSSDVRELLLLAGEHLASVPAVTRLLDRFGGHPAITALMLRHERIDDQVDPPQDLIWYTRRLAAELDEATLRTAYCAALFREGAVFEVDACLLAEGFAASDWRAAQSLSPLLRVVQRPDHAASRFSVHSVLCDVLLACSSLEKWNSEAKRLRSRAIAQLAHAGDYGRLLSLLLSACSESELAAACEVHGMALLHRCGPTAVERCLAKIPAGVVSSSCELLLLRAEGLRERDLVAEALTHASLAQRIAEVDGDDVTLAAATLVAVRAAIDATDFRRARQELAHLEGTLRSQLSPMSIASCEAYASLIEGFGGHADRAVQRMGAAMRILDQSPKDESEVVVIASCIAGVQGYLLGRWDLALSQVTSMAAWPALTPFQDLQRKANLAATMLEIGLRYEAAVMLEDVLADCTDAGLELLAAYALGTLADARGTIDASAASADFLDSQRVLTQREDVIARYGEQSLRAMLCRASGEFEESLSQAESAVSQLREESGDSHLPLVAAEIEVAASLLSLGDRWGARPIASRILSDLADSGAAMHLLLATLVLAEIERQGGDRESAIALLRPHREYIATGSANWRTAMYCRAFPGLLSMLVAAFGAEELPLRMLRLIPGETIAAAAAADPGGLSDDALAVLTVRATPEGESAEAVPAAIEDGRPRCRVRLFGGLQVTLDGAPVADECWRKRKVRLLFTMLASRCGQDIPRDVLLERLWPDMDDERARRNFYVTWSAIKRALANGGSPSSSASLVRTAGGVCGLTRAVRVDLEDFDEAIAALRMADSVHDTSAALAAARDLNGIYRGEILPGDVYEEWFAEVRERAKRDFCDAMMVAARIAESAGDSDEALVFLRKAGIADPWREDIYQAMMRCQMVSGQRSSAIETYIACRGRLVEDLGIDPSAETTRLYQAVLAMESDASEM